jgi:hypothetical protein
MKHELTVGIGPVDKKTLNLRNSRGLAIGAGFDYSETLAITPAFCRRLLEESGVLKEKTNEAIWKAILGKRPFIPNKMLCEIEDAVNCLPKNDLSCACLYVRTGEPWECGGTGLGTSSIATIRQKDGQVAARSLEHAIKLALASEFDSLGNIAEFKRIKGVQENFGLQIMNVIGKTLGNDFTGQKIIAPACSVNFLGKEYGRAFVQVEHGFFRHDNTAGSALVPRFTDPSISLGWYMNAYGLNDGTVRHVDSRDFGLDGDNLLYGLDEKAAKLTSLGGKCYFEAVRPSHAASEWTLVQYAKIKPVEKIEKPDVQDKIASSMEVVGTGVAHLEGVRAINLAPTRQDIEFNRNNKGYLLHGRLIRRCDLFDWPLSAFSNAGALYLTYSASENEFLSHVNNYARELGMPIVFSYRGFDLKTDPKAKFVAYANEYCQYGFVARV